jgi:hypothetical protein
MTIRYIIFIIALFLFQGCSTTSALHNLSGYTENGVEKDKTEFVELSDGTIIDGEITGENLRKSTGLSLFGNGSLMIGGKKYNFKEIRSLQHNNIFYSKTPYKTFAQRIVKGKINVYRTYHDATTSKGGSYTYKQHFIQKGNTGNLIWFELKVLEQMIGDNQRAMDKYNEYKALGEKDKRIIGDGYLDQVIAVYNQ